MAPVSPVLVDDGGKTWGVISGIGVVAGVVLFLSTRGPALSLATDLAAGRPAVGALLGWLPVGGLATWGGLVLWTRGRREARGLGVQRTVDRLAIAVLTPWVGLAISNLPGRDDGDDGWAVEIARPGPAFEQASQWCLWTVAVMAVWAVVPAVLVLRGRTAKPPRHVVRRLQGAIVGPPYVVLLAVLLVSSTVS